MSRSLYKDTLNFLRRCSALEVKGNHLRRLKVLASMINSCAKSKSCSLSGISTTCRSDTRQAESRVRQAKRWLCSKWTDWDTFFAPYIAYLLSYLAKSGELTLAIDGSEAGQGCCTLMLSVLWRGYAIPIVWLTRKGAKGHFSDQVHTELLQQASQLFCAEAACRVVVLGDGEFDGAQLRAYCQEQGWEYVLWTYLDRQVDFGGESARIDTLAPLLDKRRVVFVENGCNDSHAILWRGKGFKDPIPLLTNMEVGEMACKYYKKRFKIETLFKQLKSAGFQLQRSMLDDPERVQNLIIVAAMAFIFTFCIGLIVKEQPAAAVASFLRYDRMHKMSPVTVAQSAMAGYSDLAYYIFSMLSKNFAEFFSSSA
ncbi:MAG: transposase [bacterium]|nr:transposase [bacterium]